MEARQTLMEKKNAFNAYNQEYTREKLQELRSAPGYKRPYFRNNTMVLTQRIQQAKAYNDEYIQQQFVIDYNEAQQKLQAVLSSGYQMRNTNLSNPLDETGAFIILFLCLPQSSELAPNEPLGPKDPSVPAAANASAAAGAATAAANASAAAEAATAAANAARVATAAAQQATVVANAAGAPVNSGAPMSEDEGNKQTLLEINR